MARVVVQKCLESSVSVDGNVISSIGKGLMLLVGFTHGDSFVDLEYLVNKVTKLRIFEDQDGIMNKSVIDVGGSILCISQFTLYGNTKKGNRPSYVDALDSDDAILLYDRFCEMLNSVVPTYKGSFGNHMSVSLVNDGPTTILIDTK